ncbi:MAG TPA: hypothetical protein VLM85_34455 [Polyangiaceae bacterium]|nr:hypothetical protein [Polyangiaceae bacterium]
MPNRSTASDEGARYIGRVAYDPERAKRRTIANAPAWVKRHLDAVRADHPDMTDQQLIDGFGIIEALGLEETDEEWDS